MKKLIVLIIVFSFIDLYSQEFYSEAKLLKFNFGVIGGVNFNTIPTLGGSIIFEGRFNISPQSVVKLSLGFSSLFEDKQYTVKSYRYIDVENTERYQLNTYDIDKIQYSIIPLNLGLEYLFYEGLISPFGIIELGYNLYSGEEQISNSASVAYFNTLEEVPLEYQNNAPGTFDDNSYSFGFGIGAKYKISSSFDLSIRYMFRYNDKIVNSNQILFGMTF